MVNLYLEVGRSVYKALRKTWALFAVQFLLMINCAEATVKDFQGELYLNAAAGLLLTLTVPGPNTITVDKDGKWRDFFTISLFFGCLGIPSGTLPL